MAKINPNQIDVAALASTTQNNLLQYNTNGLYMALAPPENVAIQYVSSSTGNDSNPGTRAAPLKTLYRAFERLPDSTTGTIYLLEGDTFPMRYASDPAWGSPISEIGRLLVSSLRTILIESYGPQTDFYNSLMVNNASFYTFCLAANYFPRPILEFGHFTFNGTPVGSALILGQNGGAKVTLRSVECRWTAAARTAFMNAGTNYSATGYQAILNCANADLQGVILPSPMVNGSGAVIGFPVIAYGQVNPWQVYIPVESSYWINASGVNEMTFGDSGPTQVGNNSTTYNTLPATTITNLSSRILGVLKDGNGYIRNVSSNVQL